MNKYLEYEAFEKFIETHSRDELIKFMVAQQQAIDGLTQNNESFRKAYRKLLDNQANLLSGKDEH